MNRAEALEHFQKNYTEVLTKEYIDRLEGLYEAEKDELTVPFIDSFRRICILAQGAQEKGYKGKIGYITYSMRRTYLMDRHFEYVIEAFDRDWFFDQEPCRERYNASWVFTYWSDLGKGLEEYRKRYMNLIIQPDVERYLLQTTELFHDYMLKLAQYAIPQAVELPEFKRLNREDDCEIRIGEYKGNSTVILHGQDTHTFRGQETDVLDMF